MRRFGFGLGAASVLVGVLGMVAGPAFGASGAAASDKATTTATSPTINGAGTSVANPALTSWANSLGAASAPVQMSYIGGGIVNAEPNFVNNNFSVDGGTDFLSDEFPLDSSATGQLSSEGQHVAAAPVALSGLAFVFALDTNQCAGVIPRGSIGPQVTSLTLTPNLLAGIFLGQALVDDVTAPPQEKALAVTSWSDPRILALNPTLAGACAKGVKDAVVGLAQSAVYPVARQDATPENEALAQFFAQATPTIWSDYLQAAGYQGYTPSPQFPWDSTSLTESGFLVQDENTQVGDLIGGNNNTSNASQFFQTITYLATGDVAKQSAQITSAGLTPAFVQLVPNNVSVMPTTGVTAIGPTVAAVGANALTSSNGWYGADYSFSNPAAWPVPLVSSLLVPTNNLARDSAAPLAAILTYAVSATGQQQLSALNWSSPSNAVDIYGYSPLVGTAFTPLTDATQSIAAQVAAEANPSPVTTTTTTPATTTTTVARSASTTSTTVATSTGTTVPVLSNATGNQSGYTGVSSQLPTGREAPAAASSPTSDPGLAAGRDGTADHLSRPKTVAFVVTGKTVADHPRQSLPAETFGATAPWLLVLGLVMLALSWRARR